MVFFDELLEKSAPEVLAEVIPCLANLASQNPEIHDDGDLQNTVPEETNETNHADVNKKDETGTFTS